MRSILITLFLTLSYAHADSENHHATQNKNGFFVRGGFDFSNGSVKLRQKKNSEAVVISTQAMVANGLELVLGYEKYDQHIRFCFNSKLAYENIGLYEIKSTRYMAGIEGFSDIEVMNLNYGIMFGGGKATFSIADNTLTESDLTSFLGLEAYVGADGEIQGDFGYFVKLAYEVKGYDSVYSKLSTDDFRDDFVVYNINVGVGLSYKF